MEKFLSRFLCICAAVLVSTTTALADDIPVRLSGIANARPLPQKAVGAMYFATDTNQVFISYRSVWIVRISLDDSQIRGRFSGAFSGRPNSKTCVGWVYYAYDTGQSYEAFPTGWYQLPPPVVYADGNQDLFINGGFSAETYANNESSFQVNSDGSGYAAQGYFNWDTYGDVFSYGYMSFDNGSIYSDGGGDFTVSGNLLVGQIVNSDGFLVVDYDGNIYSNGGYYLSNGTVIVDTAGDLFPAQIVASGPISTPGNIALLGSTNPALTWGSTLAATRTGNATMAVGTSVGGTDGTVWTRVFRNSPVTFTNRITPPAEGMTESFTDSTTNAFGAVITGGGSYHVRGYYDGTNWTVSGN